VSVSACTRKPAEVVAPSAGVSRAVAVELLDMNTFGIDENTLSYW
jgi:hypothetical protein